MAPRKQAKQAAAESTQVAAADGNVTPPKKRKAAVKSTAPKQAKTAAPRQVRQVKAQEATVFSPKNLRSRQKNVAPKNDAEDKSKKVFVNKEKEEKKTAENDNTGEQVEKKTRGGGKSAVTKKAGTKTATAKPKAKTPVVKKRKDQVENGAENIGNGIVGDENPPKRATRRGKAADEENVAPAATKVQVIKKPRKRKTAETEAIAEADDEEPPGKNDAEMIVDKKSREKTKKTAKAAVKEKKDSTKISKGKRNVEKEVKDVEKEEGISKNLALESVDENDTSVDESNVLTHNENNKADITNEIEDDEENINGTTTFERSATFMVLDK